jgi:RNA polymerase sigma-70 factor (ECF subfamily)
MGEEPETLREKALRRAVLRGDEAAWRALYDSSFPALYRFVHLRTGRDETRTDEVVQECWMVAVRRIRAFDPSAGRFEAWLQGIARNVLRGEQRRRRQEESRRAAGTDPGQQPAPARSPELLEQVALALTELPARYQAVLRARYAEQRSVAEIAEASAQTHKTIESLLSRARAAFRHAMARLDPES